MKLSILIPARNEEFLSRTIEDILSHIEDETEIIVGLDGAWANPPIKDDPRVTIIHVSESIGQRAMTNQLCRLSKAKYVMKVDAHCAFDQGFDRKMLESVAGHDDWTAVPIMRNLHIFDWVCEKTEPRRKQNGSNEPHRRYQGLPGVCVDCGAETHKEVVWIAKTNPQSTAYCFDPEPHFQYFRGFKKRPEGRGAITETMSLQGSCFMLTRDKYWELNICDEEFGSWGSQGIEVAVKTWLSGGSVKVIHSTWYAHLFRTQGGEFGFPYPQDQSKIDRAKALAKEVFFGNKLPNQIYPLSWLVEKFWPIPGWTQADLDKLKGEPTRGILYYTDNQLKYSLAKKVRKYIKETNLPITSVSLKPIENFGNNIVFRGKRGILTMFKQILTGLEAMKEDVVFFCEHDVLYPKEHFDFIPPKKDVYYYDKNVWRIRPEDGHAAYYDHKALHCMCAWRETLIKEFKERVRRVESEGFNNGGFEPGTRSLNKHGFSDSTSEYYEGLKPVIDIRHGENLSASKWKPEDFKSQRSCRNWKDAENYEIPGWDNLKKLFVG